MQTALRYHQKILVWPIEHYKNKSACVRCQSKVITVDMAVLPVPVTAMRCCACNGLTTCVVVGEQEQAFMRDFSTFANGQAPVNGTAGNITSWSW